MELADWWTTFQEVDLIEKEAMVSELTKSTPHKPSKRQKPAKVGK